MERPKFANLFRRRRSWMVDLSLILVFLGGMSAAFDWYAPPHKDPTGAASKALFFLDGRVQMGGQ